MKQIVLGILISILFFIYFSKEKYIEIEAPRESFNNVHVYRLEKNKY